MAAKKKFLRLSKPRKPPCKQISEFNESTFQLCYLHELIVDIGKRGEYRDKFRVHVPTLTNEGKKSGGFDARIRDYVGSQMFFQFKIAQKRCNWTGDDSKEIGRLGGVGLEKPYRQFKIHSKEQHNALVRHATDGDCLYVAPMFLTEADLWSYAIAGQVRSNSIQIVVKPGSSVRIKKHRYVFYPEDPTWWRFFSKKSIEPEKQALFSTSDVLKRLESQPLPFRKLVQRAYRGLPPAAKAKAPVIVGKRGRLGGEDLMKQYWTVRKALRDLGITWVLILRPEIKQEPLSKSYTINLQ